MNPAHKHLYNWRWRKLRARFLANNPLCCMCTKAGRVTVATVVDHIKPHNGDVALFWDSLGNWQSLCASHHSASKQRQDKRGYEIGCSADGIPIDATHHWNTGGEGRDS